MKFTRSKDKPQPWNRERKLLRIEHLEPRFALAVNVIGSSLSVYAGADDPDISDIVERGRFQDDTSSAYLTTNANQGSHSVTSTGSYNFTQERLALPNGTIENRIRGRFEGRVDYSHDPSSDGGHVGAHLTWGLDDEANDRILRIDLAWSYPSGKADGLLNFPDDDFPFFSGSPNRTNHRLVDDYVRTLEFSLGQFGGFSPDEHGTTNEVELDFELIIVTRDTSKDPSGRIRSLSFGGSNIPILPDPGTANPLFDPYKSHFLDSNVDGFAEQSHPILYVANSTLSVSVDFLLTQLPPSGGYVHSVYGTATGGYVFQKYGPTFTGNRVSAIDITADKAFEAIVTKTSDFAIQWTLVFVTNTGIVTVDAGTTHNTLYVSAANPGVLVTKPATPLDPPDGIYETIVDIAITRNLGMTAASPQQLIEGSWTYFDMNSSSDALRVDGTELTYWGFGPKPVRYSAAGLLQLTAGSCEAWSRFFLEVLAVNGVFADENEGILELYSPLEEEGILIERVAYAPDAKGWGNYQYIWNATVRSYEEFGGTVLRDYTEILDDTGLAGQHNENPVPNFVSHVIVRIGGTLFDPSYGKRFGTVVEWEDASLAGMYKKADKGFIPNSDSHLFLERGYLFRKQTEGLPDLLSQLDESYYFVFTPPLATQPALSTGVSVSSATFEDANADSGLQTSIPSASSFGWGALSIVVTSLTAPNPVADIAHASDLQYRFEESLGTANASSPPRDIEMHQLTPRGRLALSFNRPLASSRESEWSFGELKRIDAMDRYFSEAIDETTSCDICIDFDFLDNTLV